MANILPIKVVMAALPPTVRWTPQQLAQAIVERLSLQTVQAFSLFTVGSTEPSSNVGPWFKQTGGTYELYVWSDTEGGYVPIQIPQESLGYFIGSSAPDQNIYNFWIETTVGGSPLALKIYYSGAWTDVYATTLGAYMTTAAFNAAIANYSTTAQMNAAIAAAIAAIPSGAIGESIFKATPTANQDVVFGGAGTMTGDVTLGTEVFDPDGVFASNEFTVPAGGEGFYQLNGSLGASVSAGAPTDVDMRAYFGINGAPGDSFDDSPISTSLAGRVLVGSSIVYLNVGDTVSLYYSFTLDAAGTVRITPAGTFLAGYRVR